MNIKNRTRNSNYRNCLICDKQFHIQKMVWRKRIGGGKLRICTNICVSCHPDLNTTCYICKEFKPNTLFNKSQLNLHSDKKCKICYPYKRSERQKISQAAYMANPENRKRASHLANERAKIRRKTDINFRLRLALRTRICSVLKGKVKHGSAVKDLGCSIEFLRSHLESQFKPGMSWDNYGNKVGQWSIDHIYPLSKVDLTDREQFLMVCNYKNLRPMWHTENISKGNKIIHI